MTELTDVEKAERILKGEWCSVCSLVKHADGQCDKCRLSRLHELIRAQFTLGVKPMSRT